MLSASTVAATPNRRNTNRSAGPIHDAGSEVFGQRVSEHKLEERNTQAASMGI